jgi:retron-type reverse transcriptase
MREIFVPTFRDRVVHHLLANWLRPKLEKLFIYDNYAGRQGRGTLFGIRRAEKYMRQVTQNYQKEAFVLKLDIASYFRSIPKDILWENLQKTFFPSSSYK